MLPHRVSNAPSGIIGASAASRPWPIRTRPMLGTMLRGSKVYQRAAEIGLEPAGEVHRDRGRRDADVAKIARAIARRNVHATAEGDCRVGIVAANAGGFV